MLWRRSGASFSSRRWSSRVFFPSWLILLLLVLLVFITLASLLHRGCSRERLDPPTNLRGTLMPPPAPFGHFLSIFGYARLRLNWDPSPALESSRGSYRIFRVSGERLDLREEVAVVPSALTSATIPILMSKQGPPPLFEVIAESATGGRSEPSRSGLVLSPRYLAGVGLWHPHGMPPELPPAPVTALLADAEGAIFVGYRGAGLARIEARDGRIQRFSSLNGLLDDHVLSLASDGFGQIWVGTARGVQRLDPRSGRFTTWTKSRGGPSGAVVSLALDSLGVLRMVSDGELWRVAPTTQVPLRLGSQPEAVPPSSNPLRDLRELVEQRQWMLFLGDAPRAALGVHEVATAPDGAVWIAGEGAGIARQTPDSLSWRTLVPYSAVSEAGAGHSLRLAPEAGETAWILGSAGVFHLSPGGGLRSLALPPGLEGRAVQDLTVRGPGVALAVIDGRLLLCKAQQEDCLLTTAPLDEPPDSSALELTRVAVPPDGSVWLGAADGTLERRDRPLDTVGRRFAPSSHSPPVGAAVDLAMTGHAQVWVATPSGLVVRCGLTGTWRTPGASGSSAAAATHASRLRRIAALDSDSTGNLYALVDGAPSIRFNEPPLWSHLSEIGAPQVEGGHLLTRGGDGRVWYGSRERIVGFTPGESPPVELRSFHPKDENAAPLALAATSAGGIWIGSTAGLSHWRPSATGGEPAAAAPEVGGGPVTALHLDPTGPVHFATSREFKRLTQSTGELARAPLPTGWAGDPVVAIVPVRSSRLALVTQGGQVGCLEKWGAPVRHRFAVLPEGAAVSAAKVDQKGAVWLATAPRGLMVIPSPCGP